MTEEPRGRSGWTKDQAGALFAGAAGVFWTQGVALDWTKHVVPDYAHTVAYLIASIAGILAFWVALRIMKRLP